MLLLSFLCVFLDAWYAGLRSTTKLSVHWNLFLLFFYLLPSSPDRGRQTIGPSEVVFVFYLLFGPPDRARKLNNLSVEICFLFVARYAGLRTTTKLSVLRNNMINATVSPPEFVYVFYFVAIIRTCIISDPYARCRCWEKTQTDIALGI